MFDRQANRLIWIALVAVIVALAWQFQNQLEMVFSSRGTLTVDKRTDAVVLAWRGKIEAPMAQRLWDAYSEHRNDTRRFVISLHSPGGTLAHGRDVIQIIRRMQNAHRVDTVVEAGRACASMCVPVYLTGNTRTASPRARFMFHEVSYRDSESGKIERVPSASIGRATDRFFELYLKPAGLDQKWLAGLRNSIRGRDVWLSAQELVDRRTGVVQRLQ